MLFLGREKYTGRPQGRRSRLNNIMVIGQQSSVIMLAINA